MYVYYNWHEYRLIYLYITIGKETENIMANLTQDIVNGPTPVSNLTITFCSPLVTAQMQMRRSAMKGEMKLRHFLLRKNNKTMSSCESRLLIWIF